MINNENTFWDNRTIFFLCLEEMIGPPKYNLKKEWSDLLTEKESDFIWQSTKNTIIPEKDQHLGLTLDEIACLLVYNFYGKYRPYYLINTWLRDLERPVGKYTTTVTHIYNALVKLSRRPENISRTVYRGIHNTFLDFNPNDTGFYGGVWYAFTSCTYDKKVNEDFLKDSGTEFEIIEGEEDEGGIHKGVTLPNYISFTPGLKEVIYPPLTLFKILQKNKIGNKIKYVVETAYRSVSHLPLIIPNDTIWKAVKDNNISQVTEWLKSHPSVNLEYVHPQYGCCLLYSACSFGYLDIVRALVKRCAHIDSQVSRKKSTALHVACYKGHMEVVKYLLSQGADPTLINDYQLSPISEASTEEIRKLLINTKKQQQLDHSDNKMVCTLLIYGDRLSYIRGLKEFLGEPVLTLEEEFQRNIIFTEKWTKGGHCKINTTHLWNEALTRMDDLLQEEEASDLSFDEIMALHLYTGPSYKLVNEFLRKLQNSDNKKRSELLSKQNSWVATIIHINDGIRKICKKAKIFPVAYRGVGGILQPEFFIPDKRGLIAATEYGFMSTSEDYDMATEFSKDDPHSTVFVIKCRKEDIGGYHMGAHLEWCTTSKGEKEVLFPPLTMFEILDRERQDSVTTITVVPHFI